MWIFHIWTVLQSCCCFKRSRMNFQSVQHGWKVPGVLNKMEILKSTNFRSRNMNKNCRLIIINYIIIIHKLPLCSDFVIKYKCLICLIGSLSGTDCNPFHLINASSQTLAGTLSDYWYKNTAKAGRNLVAQLDFIFLLVTQPLLICFVHVCCLWSWHRLIFINIVHKQNYSRTGFS